MFNCICFFFWAGTTIFVRTYIIYIQHSLFIGETIIFAGKTTYVSPDGVKPHCVHHFCYFLLVEVRFSSHLFTTNPPLPLQLFKSFELQIADILEDMSFLEGKVTRVTILAEPSQRGRSLSFIPSRARGYRKYNVLYYIYMIHCKRGL